MSKKIAALREARNVAVTAMRALLDKAEAENRDLVEVEQAEYSKLDTEQQRLLQQIDREEKLAEAERSLAERRLRDDQDRRDPRIEVFAKRTKPLVGFTDEKIAYRMGMWARANLFNDQRAAQWCNENEIRVMTGAATSKGGAVVPEELSQAIIDLRETYGLARRLCRVYPMQSDTVLIPRRTGGVTAYFVSEETEVTASDKSWDQVQLVARKLAALTKFSSDYAEDAVIDVAGDLANEMAYAFAQKEDDCWINGTGASTYGHIVGMRSKLIDGAHTAGAIDGATGHDTFAEMDADDLLSVIGALPVYAEGNARWLVSKRGNTLMFDALKAAAGGNDVVTLGGKPQRAYLGDPIEISQAMPTSTGDLSDVVMALYGDFSLGCTLGDRRGFTVKVLMERYAEYDQIGIIGTERVDIVCHDLGDTSSAGPVVGLVGE